MAAKKKKTKRRHVKKDPSLIHPPETPAQAAAADKKAAKVERVVDKWISTGRLQSLTDGIFAFAMTLLVLNLILPDPANLPPETQLNDILWQQSHAFYNYLLSFVLLAIFWTIHTQQFHVIKGTNRVHTWINLTIMLFIVLIPFSTSVMADYPDDTTANVLFSLNMLIVGLLFYLNWSYAASPKHRLVDPTIDDQAIILSTRRALITPIVSVLALVLAFVAPEYTGLCFLLIPIVKAMKPFNR